LAGDDQASKKAFGFLMSLCTNCQGLGESIQYKYKSRNMDDTGEASFTRCSFCYGTGVEQGKRHRSLVTNDQAMESAIKAVENYVTKMKVKK